MATHNLNDDLLNEDSQPARNTQVKDAAQPTTQRDEASWVGEELQLGDVAQLDEVLQFDEKLLLGEVLQLSDAAEGLLRVRPDVVRYLAESYRALYIEDQALTRPVRHALATIAARRQGNEVLTRHHGALADPALIGEELPDDLKLEAIIEHVDLITVSPGLVEPEDQYTLQLAGVTPEEIVLLSQIVAYTSTLVRVIDGYALLAGESAASDTVTPEASRTQEVSALLAGESAGADAQQDSVPQDSAALDFATLEPETPQALNILNQATPQVPTTLNPTTPLARAVPDLVTPLERPTVAAGRIPAPKVRTTRGSEIPTAFTTDVLDWEPWVTPPSVNELTEAQLDSFASKAAANSEYFRLLALVPNVLKARSALDNAIFLGENGLPRGERELAAAVTSKVNGCIFCASVHARKAAFQTKRPEDVDRLLAVSLSRDENWLPAEVEHLAEGQDERWNALILFEARLSQLIPQATAADVERLYAAGLTPEQIGDAILSVAFFSWANRLMLSLGEPAIPGTGLAR
ncbi:MAG: peroxidase-related enzyme [Ancrocorticia sp.]